MVRYIQKRWVAPTKVKSHKRKIKGKTVRVSSYKRNIPRVTYGFTKNTTNAQYRQAMRKLAPFADADGDGVRNWDDCMPFDRTRRDEKSIYRVEVNFDESAESKEKYIKKELSLPEARAISTKLLRDSRKNEVTTTELEKAGLSTERIMDLLAEGHIFEPKRGKFKLL